MSESVHPALDPDQWTKAVPDHAVMVADGQQVKVTVRDGHLTIEDGVPSKKRVRKISRVPREVTRLVILSRRGYITFEALRWLKLTNIAVTHIAEDVTMTTGTHEGDARVIIAQANKNGVVARYLISKKLWGQAETLRYRLGANNITKQLVAQSVALLNNERTTVDFIRGYEGRAAQDYWNAWRGIVRVPWSPADLVRVPAHWRSYPGRPTLGRDWESNRGATDPVNAMLNYAYKVLETETLNACRMYGMHPDIGVIHAYKTDRHAFVLDLMEPGRPFVDRLVLQFLNVTAHDGYFERRWVHEEGDGRCVLDPPLTHIISGWAADIGAEVQEHAMKVRDYLFTRKCESGCGCRYGTDDPDRRDCACDGPCGMASNDLWYGIPHPANG